MGVTQWFFGGMLPHVLSIFGSRTISWPGLMTSSFGWVPPLPRLLHCPVFLLAPAWEFFFVGNQCDKYPVKIMNIQVDITFIIPKLIDGVSSFTCQRSLMA